MSPVKSHYVSPSALSEFRKCPKCFYIDRNEKLKRPRGAFPTLPGGIDRILKSYFDVHRADGTLPPEIRDALPDGTKLYADTEKLKAMRNARYPLLKMTIGNVTLAGGLDELLVRADGAVSPFDYKTKGNVITEDKDPFEYYRMQLNDYGLMLKTQGFTITGKGYLGYWSPSEARNGKQETLVFMRCQVFEMDMDLDAATDEVVAAGKLLDEHRLPESSPSCDWCAWIANRIG